jgi:hypothetical protein
MNADKKDIEKLKQVSFDDLQKMLNRIENLLGTATRIANRCDEQAKKMHELMLELKGCLVLARPRVKKNAWYGEELQGEVVKESLEIELKK